MIPLIPNAIALSQFLYKAHLQPPPNDPHSDSVFPLHTSSSTSTLPTSHWASISNEKNSPNGPLRGLLVLLLIVSQTAFAFSAPRDSLYTPSKHLFWTIIGCFLFWNGYNVTKRTLKREEKELYYYQNKYMRSFISLRIAPMVLTFWIANLLTVGTYLFYRPFGGQIVAFDNPSTGLWSPFINSLTVFGSTKGLFNDGKLDLKAIISAIFGLRLFAKIGYYVISLICYYSIFYVVYRSIGPKSPFYRQIGLYLSVGVLVWLTQYGPYGMELPAYALFGDGLMWRSTAFCFCVGSTVAQVTQYSWLSSQSMGVLTSSRWSIPVAITFGLMSFWSFRICLYTAAHNYMDLSMGISTGHAATAKEIAGVMASQTSTVFRLLSLFGLRSIDPIIRPWAYFNVANNLICVFYHTLTPVTTLLAFAAIQNVVVFGSDLINRVSCLSTELFLLHPPVLYSFQLSGLSFRNPWIGTLMSLAVVGYSFCLALGWSALIRPLLYRVCQHIQVVENKINLVLDFTASAIVSHYKTSQVTYESLSNRFMDQMASVSPFSAPQSVNHAHQSSLSTDSNNTELVPFDEDPLIEAFGLMIGRWGNAGCERLAGAFWDILGSFERTFVTFWDHLVGSGAVFEAQNVPNRSVDQFEVEREGDRGGDTLGDTTPQSTPSPPRRFLLPHQNAHFGTFLGHFGGDESSDDSIRPHFTSPMVSPVSFNQVRKFLFWDILSWRGVGEEDVDVPNTPQMSQTPLNEDTNVPNGTHFGTSLSHSISDFEDVGEDSEDECGEKLDDEMTPKGGEKGPFGAQLGLDTPLTAPNVPNLGHFEGV